MKLSRRLQTVADLLPGEFLWRMSVPTERELSYYLLEQGKVTRAILSDSSRHSLESSKTSFGGTCYEQCVEFRHGSLVWKYIGQAMRIMPSWPAWEDEPS